MTTTPGPGSDLTRIYDIVETSVDDESEFLSPKVRHLYRWWAAANGGRMPRRKSFDILDHRPIVANLFDERNPAVKKMLSMAIKAARAKGKYIGICGQGPSDHPDLAEWLMAEGIESVSLNPDTVVDTWLRLAKTKAG